MRKKYRYFILIILMTPLLILLFCNLIISYSAKGKIFTSLEEIPNNRVGLVLGTSKKLTDGQPNPYYTNRITSTIELFKAGKIEFILVSGDNGSIYYNEPYTFKKDLILGGIPEDKIFLDYAGFRTLDSMIRAKSIFGLDSVTVISQEFHVQRAIFLAEQKDLTAIGFAAKDISTKQGLKVNIREYFARVKVFIDLALNTQPKFYGEHVQIK